MEDEHAPHSSSGVVEHPLPLVLVVCGKAHLGVVRHELGDERVDDDAGVARGAGGRSGGEGGEDGGVQGGRGEEVETGLRSQLGSRWAGSAGNRVERGEKGTREGASIASRKLRVEEEV